MVNGSPPHCRVSELHKDAWLGPRLEPPILFLVWLKVAVQVLHVWGLAISVVWVDNDLLAYDPLRLAMELVLVEDGFDPLVLLRELCRVDVLARLDAEGLCRHFDALVGHLDLVAIGEHCEGTLN